MSKLFMVFDVESNGLHGEGFAYGFTVIDETGTELDSGLYCCPVSVAKGHACEDLNWVTSNVPYITFPRTCANPHALRAHFLGNWARWQSEGATLWADCAWPVEARFLISAIEDNLLQNKFAGPYPLHDIASVLFAKGYNPVGNYGRLESELPAHNPLNDARQSARVLLAAMNGTLNGNKV